MDVSQLIKERKSCRAYLDKPVDLELVRTIMDKNMPKGSWIDVGMFLQNILLSAKEFGLATCPQAALAEYPDVVRRVLGIQDIDIVCGISLGYEDEAHPLNSYRTERESTDFFTRWYN